MNTTLKAVSYEGCALESPGELYENIYTWFSL